LVIGPVYHIPHKCPAQESGAALHGDTLALATKACHRNDARDFFSFNQIPVATWYSWEIGTTLMFIIFFANP